MSEFEPDEFEELEAPPPDSRNYVHLTCGQPTCVSKGDFREIVNPFLLSDRTYCVSCQKMDALERFVWADTGETIAAFRQRMRDLTPASFLHFRRFAPPVATALGAGMAWRYTSSAMGLLAGGVVGCLLPVIVLLANPLRRMIWGIDYRRMHRQRRLPFLLVNFSIGFPRSRG